MWKCVLKRGTNPITWIADAKGQQDLRVWKLSSELNYQKKCHHYALMMHLCLDIDEIPPGHIYPLSSVDLLSFHVVHLITYSKSQMLITTLQV